MCFITIVPVAPLRAEASHRSEMVSQLLFGELCDVLETTKDFLKVRCRYDNYEGWCQRSQLTDYGADSYIQQTGYVSSFITEVLVNGESCIVPFSSVAMQQECNIGPYHLSFLAEVITPTADSDKAKLVYEFANRFLGVSYLWGGKSVFGTDCSGFAQQVFKMAGIQLPRDAYQQAELGELVNFVQESRAGDLAFFDNEEGRITHVGIMLNNQYIIHAAGDVHIDPIDHLGIVHHIRGERTHKLRVIKRYF